MSGTSTSTTDGTATGDGSGDGSTDTTGTGDGSGTGAGTGGRTFTQAELDAQLGKVRNQAGATARREIAELLGVPVEEAKRLLDERAEADRAQMTEAERIRKDAEAATAAAEAAQAAAARETLRARVQSALLLPVRDASGAIVGLPVRADRIEVALDVAMAKAVAPDAGDDPVSTANTAVRTLSPEWFTPPETTDTTTTKPGTPPPPGRPGGESGGGNPSPAAAAKAKFDAWKSEHKQPTDLLNLKKG